MRWEGAAEPAAGKNYELDKPRSAGARVLRAAAVAHARKRRREAWRAGSGGWRFVLRKRGRAGGLSGHTPRSAARGKWGEAVRGSVASGEGSRGVR